MRRRKTSEQDVCSLIPVGNERRIKECDISSSLSITGPTVRKHINKLRAEATPVCSDGNGYYISNDPDEIAKTIRHLESRAEKISAAIDGMREAQLSAFHNR